MTLWLDNIYAVLKKKNKNKASEEILIKINYFLQKVAINRGGIILVTLSLSGTIRKNTGQEEMILCEAELRI